MIERVERLLVSDLLTKLAQTVERKQTVQFMLSLLITQTELSPRICQIKVIVDSDFLIFLYGHQRHHSTSFALDVWLPNTVGLTGMVYSRNPEIQVLAGLVRQSVGHSDRVDVHDSRQFVRDRGVVFAPLRIKQLQNILDLLIFGDLLLC